MGSVQGRTEHWTTNKLAKLDLISEICTFFYHQLYNFIEIITELIKKKKVEKNSKE